MKLDYFFFYTEANLVCMIVLGLLLLHNMRNGTRQEKQIWFDRTIVAHLAYFLSDTGWAAVLSRQIEPNRFLAVLFNFTNYILLSLIAYLWFMYMASCVDLKLRNTPRGRRIWLAPMALSLLVIVAAYIADPFAVVDANLEPTALYYILFVSAPVIYLAAAFVFAMNKARQTTLKEDKLLYRLIGIYPISVVVFGLIQTFSLNAPLFCFGCTTMMVFFYIQNMQSLVSVDSLTRLNNRGQINRYITQNRYRENMRTYAVMIDIDSFKKINDTYGHAEGDRALTLVSEVLKRFVDQVKAAVFIGRYGGDEFTLFLQCGEGDSSPEEMLEAIRAALRERQEGENLPYVLNISAGWDLLQGREDTLEACLERADRKLYEYKRAAKIGR